VRDALVQDLRLAVRSLRKTPGLVVLAMLCMGLGIGAVTSMYSTAVAFTFRPIPEVRDAGRVMHVWEGPAKAPGQEDGISAGALQDVRALPVFSDVVAVQWRSDNLTGSGVPEQVRTAKVSAGALHALGRRPMLGREFTAADAVPGADRVVMLSYGLWRRRYGGDSAIVGRTVHIDGEDFTVRGILPEDFVFPPGVSLWMPLVTDAAALADRGSRDRFALARLAPGVTPGQAEAAVGVLGDRLAARYPAASDGWVVRAEPAEQYFGAGPRPFMVVLLAASAFVLLMACANVANLLLARATSRRRELAVRIALGVGRARLVRGLLMESVLVALGGAAFGVLLAAWGLAGLTNGVPVEVRALIPGFGRMHLDGPAFVVTAAVAVGTGLLFGLAPVYAASHLDVQASLRDGARGEVGGLRGGRLRNALVAVEIALALVLLFGATEMLATFRRVALADPGFRRDGVLTATVTLPSADYPNDSTVLAFDRNLEEGVAALPGVEAVGMTTILPFSMSEDREGVEVEGAPPRRPEDAPQLGLRAVSAGYLRLLDIPLRSGRGLTAQDDAGQPLVGVVSEAAAQLLWPGGSPLGKRVKVPPGRWVEVVGVVDNVRGSPLHGGDLRPVIYLSDRQWPARRMTLVVRSSRDPVALTPVIQREIGALDPRLAAGDVMPMRRVIMVSVSPWSATSETLDAAALVALLLACFGIYGVVSYSVTQRTREIGVRVALGATTAAVIRMVFGGVLRVAGAGVAVGLVGALALSRGLRAVLVDSRATDPAALAFVVAVLAGVAAAASWMPARRAARVDPMEALRSE